MPKTYSLDRIVPSIYSSNRIYPEYGIYTICLAEKRRDMKNYYKNLWILHSQFIGKLDEREIELGSLEAAAEEAGDEVIETGKDMFTILNLREIKEQEWHPYYLEEILYVWTVYCPDALHYCGALWEYVAGEEMPPKPPLNGPFKGDLEHEEQLAKEMAKKEAAEIEAKKVWWRIQDAKPIFLR